MLCADFTRLSIWWMGLREYCMLNSLFSISNFRASCFTADSYMLRMTRNSCVLSNEPACVLSIIRTVRSVLLYPKTGSAISKYIIPYICDFFYCFCFNSPFWEKHGFWRKAVRYFLQKKSPAVLFRRIPHNIIIVTHNKVISQYIQNKKKRFVYKHKTESRNSYILPIVFLRKICYSIDARRKRWFQWPEYPLLYIKR